MTSRLGRFEIMMGEILVLIKKLVPSERRGRVGRESDGAFLELELLKKMPYLKICRDFVEHGHTVSKFTNESLKGLLDHHFSLEISKTYGTDLFPFIKPGPINDSIPRSDMNRAAIEYGVPQIEIIRNRGGINRVEWDWQRMTSDYLAQV